MPFLLVVVETMTAGSSAVKRRSLMLALAASRGGAPMTLPNAGSAHPADLFECAVSRS